MLDVDGYKVVKLKRSPNDENCHNIYMKEHYIRLMDPNKPKGRTLFLLNVPPYVTEKSLELFFNRIGPVISVTFAAKPGRDETDNWSQNMTLFSNKKAPFKFKVAYIVFKTTNSVERSLSVKSIDLFNEATGEIIIETGMQLWHSQYLQTFLDIAETQNSIDNYMASYDEKESTTDYRNTETDADGWVTVGKQGKNAGFEQKDAVLSKLEHKIERAKKKKELTNFYTFQIRESKMKNILELKKKFEDDKKKIEVLKKIRRFRPF